MCQEQYDVHTVRYVIVYSFPSFYFKMEPIVNPGFSCQRQQRGKITVTQPKFCVEDGGLLEIVFFAIKVTFVGLSVSD